MERINPKELKMVSSKDDVDSLFRFDSSSDEDGLAFHDDGSDDMFTTEGLFEDMYPLEEFGLVPENTATIGEASTASDDEQSHQQRGATAFIASLSDEKLEKMRIQDLNKHLRRLPDSLITKVRKRRRILKNRKYSLKFRQKGCERKNSIAAENSALEFEICQAKETLRKVRKERDEYKQKYTRLKRTVAAANSQNVEGLEAGHKGQAVNL